MFPPKKRGRANKVSKFDALYLLAVVGPGNMSTLLGSSCLI